MTDQIPADKVRDLRDQYARLIEDAGTKEARAYYGHVVKDLEALLPPPPRPTLADMTDEERDACTGMQADAETGEPVIIIDGTERSDGRVQVLSEEIYVYLPFATDITPRPDLPRLEWPGDKEPAPAPALPDGWRLADHPKHGRVIVTALPSDSDDRAYFVHPDFEDDRGFDWQFCDPDDLTYIDTDQGDDTPTAPDHLAVGTVIESADDPRLAALPYGSMLIDRDGGVFDVTKTETGEWDGPGYVPAQGTGTKWGPWTVRRIGREADQ